MKRVLSLLLALSAPLFVPTLAIAAQNATPTVSQTSIEPAAFELLERSAKAYAALDGLSMSFSVFDETGGKKSALNGTLAFSRPGQAKLEFTVGKRISQTVTDGEKLYTTPNTVSYLLDEAAIQSVAARIPSGLSIPLIFLTIGENPLSNDSAMADVIKWNSAALLPDNGVVLRTPDNGINPVIEFRLFFGKTDLLLRRVEVTATVRGQKMLNITTISQVRANPIFAPDSFKFVADTGAKERLITPRYDPKIKVGAEPYALEGIDFNAYRGKVLLVDFWATWCPPCIIELPNIQANYEKYHSKGFEIIGISLDENRDTLQEFVNMKKLPWPQLLDSTEPTKSSALRYGVAAIPFSFLLGKDGKIVAVNPQGKRLEKEIVKALE